MYTPYSTIGDPVRSKDSPGGLAPERAITFRDVANFLREAGWIIGLSAGAFVFIALVYIAITPPRYTATAQIIIDMDQGSGPLPSDTRQALMSDEARIESQIEVIKSDGVALEVITALGYIDDPELADRSPSLFARVRSWLFDSASDGEQIPPESYAIADLREHLTVRRVGQSSVVEISFASQSPYEAARTANAVATAYIRRDVAAKSDAARRHVDWLAARLEALRGDAQRSMRAVERFKVVGPQTDEDGEPTTLAELESVADIYTKVYEAFLQTYAETAQKVSYPEADARVVSAAAVPLGKSYPKGKLILAFALVLGAAAGIAAAAILRVTDRRVRSADHIAAELGIAAIGVVGRAEARPGGGNSLGRLVDSARRVISGPTAEPPAAIPIIGRGISTKLLREIRELKFAISAVLLGRKSPSIGVVAVGRGEGSSTIAINLAFLNAISGVRTLLVDTCVENPTVTREFALSDEDGLMQALQDRETCERLLAAAKDRDLCVMPIGKINSPLTPGDRIGSERAAFQIDGLKKHFDLLVFDLPSIAESPDANAIAPFLDGILVVAKAGSTSIDAIGEAITAIQAARGNVIGVVLNMNGVEPPILGVRPRAAAEPAEA